VRTIESRPRVFKQAVMNADLPTIDRLLKTDRRLANAVVDHQTMLQAAVSHADAPVVRRLLDAKADPRAQLPEHTAATLLHRAAKYGDAETLQLLLKAGANPDARGEHGNTALHDAVIRARGRAGKVAALIEAGGDVNATNDENLTPLHYAARTGDLPTVRLLIDSGANVNARSDRGDTPLHSATGFGLSETARFLLDAGADISATDLTSAGNQQNLPADLWWHKIDSLHTAGQFDRIRDLLEKRRSALKLTGQAGTLLHRAVRHKRDPLINLLLDLGADPNAPDFDGQTALHACVATLENDGPAVAAVLLKHQADPRVRDRAGATPLDLAVRHNRGPRLIEILSDAARQPTGFTGQASPRAR
jgi:ankyrin repeat protein